MLYIWKQSGKGSGSEEEGSFRTKAGHYPGAERTGFAVRPFQNGKFQKGKDRIIHGDQIDSRERRLI